MLTWNSLFLILEKQLLKHVNLELLVFKENSWIRLNFYLILIVHMQMVK